MRAVRLALLLISLLRVSDAWAIPARAYVTSGTTNPTLQVIEGTTVLASQPSLGKNPFDVAVSPSGLRVYVTNNGDGTVWEFDTSDLSQPLHKIQLSTGTPVAQPQFVAVHPLGTRVYVSDASTNTLFVIDVSGSGSPPPPTAIPINASGNLGQLVAVAGPPVKVYVLDDGGQLHVRNEAGDQLADPISLTLGSPVRITRNPDGSRVYITYELGQISVVDNDGTVTTCPIDRGQAEVVAITPDGSRMLVSTFHPDSVRFFSVAPNGCPDSCAAWFDMPPLPKGLAISRDGTQAYVVPRPQMGAGVKDINPKLQLSPQDASDVCSADAPSSQLPVDTIPIAQPQAFGDFVGPDTGSATTTTTIQSGTTTTTTTTPTRPTTTPVTTVTSTTLACGNGVVDPGEQCDPAIPGSENCCFACTAYRIGSPCTTRQPAECELGDLCNQVGVCQTTYRGQETTCRPAQYDGACDAGDVCDGRHAECPVTGDGILCSQNVIPPPPGDKKLTALCSAPTPAKGKAKCQVIGRKASVEQGQTSARTSTETCAGQAVTALVTKRLKPTQDPNQVASEIKPPLNDYGRKLLKKLGSLDVCVKITLVYPQTNLKKTYVQVVTLTK